MKTPLKLQYRRRRNGTTVIALVVDRKKLKAMQAAEKEQAPHFCKECSRAMTNKNEYCDECAERG